MTTSYVECPICHGELIVDVRWNCPADDINDPGGFEVEDVTRTCEEGCPWSENSRTAAVEYKLEYMNEHPDEYIDFI